MDLLSRRCILGKCGAVHNREMAMISPVFKAGPTDIDKFLP